MSPPQLRHPEWFLRNIVDQKVMEELLDRITRFYDDLFMEVIYRAHHNSFKVGFADVFYNDFINYVVRACGLKKKVFWKYLPEGSVLKYMHRERRRFFNYLRKPPSKRRRHIVGDIRWSFNFWLSQLSFWYGTVKSFANVWRKVVLDGENIPHEVDWDEAITLYLISDFIWSARKSSYQAVKKQWRDKYMRYAEIELKKTIV